MCVAPLSQTERRSAQSASTSTGPALAPAAVGALTRRGGRTVRISARVQHVTESRQSQQQGRQVQPAHGGYQSWAQMMRSMMDCTAFKMASVLLYFI